MDLNTRIRTYQMLDAGHDYKGNPMRVWVCYEYGDLGSYRLIAVYDEGYKGRPDWQGIELPALKVTNDQYREFSNQVTD